MEHLTKGGEIALDHHFRLRPPGRCRTSSAAWAGGRPKVRVGGGGPRSLSIHKLEDASP